MKDKISDTLGLTDITNLVLGILVGKETPMQKRKKVQDVLTIVYAAGKGMPVMDVAGARQALPGTKFSETDIMYPGYISGTIESVSISGIFTKKELMALVYWMDNSDLFEEGSKDVT